MKNKISKKKILKTEQDIQRYLEESIPAIFNANFDGKKISFQNGDSFEINITNEK